MVVLEEKEGAEEKFKSWAEQVKTIGSQDTIDTYWNQIKGIPDFDLTTMYKDSGEVEDRNEEEIKERDRIGGLIERNISSEHQLQAVRRLIKSKIHYLKKNEDIPHMKYMRIKIRANELLDNIDVDETDTSTIYDKIENHFIYKEDLVELLRRADPTRARYWAATYLLGVRWFASKTLEDDLFFRDRGEYGMVRIPVERTKSKETRDVYLNSPWFWQLLDSAPKGNWEDRHGRKWEGVYFPDRDHDKENYQLGKKQNGKIYGLVGEIGLSPRTMHSFRHTRITDLLKGDGMQISEVQDRVGHSETGSTNHYKQVKFNRDPKSLEQYCDEKDIDLMEVVESE